MRARKIALDLSDISTFDIAKKDLEKSISRLINPTRDDMKRLTKIVSKDYLNPMLDDLRVAPKARKYPSDYPLIFTSDLQRKYVMGFVLKNNIPYRRTGKITKSWQYTFSHKGKNIYVRIENTLPESQFIIGKLGVGRSSSSIRKYLKPMQKFHQKTGWTPSHEIVKGYITKMEKNSNRIIQEWLNY